MTGIVEASSTAESFLTPPSQRKGEIIHNKSSLEMGREVTQQLGGKIGCRYANSKRWTDTNINASI
eukprot:6199066-Pleurochrysis_carterae.AAC.4